MAMLNADLLKSWFDLIVCTPEGFIIAKCSAALRADCEDVPRMTIAGRMSAVCSSSDGRIDGTPRSSHDAVMETQEAPRLARVSIAASLHIRPA